MDTDRFYKSADASKGEWSIWYALFMLEEPYLVEKALGECNIEMPYQVPDGTVFVMGDHRSTSIDSRNSSVGCIHTDDIVGKIIFRIWPLSQIGFLTQNGG